MTVVRSDAFKATIDLYDVNIEGHQPARSSREYWRPDGAAAVSGAKARQPMTSSMCGVHMQRSV